MTKNDTLISKEATNQAKKKRKKGVSAVSAFTLVAFFVIWQLICMLNESQGEPLFINPKFLPSPHTIILKFIELVENGSLVTHMIASSSRMLWGFLWGLGVAVALGVLVTSFKLADAIVSPILGMIQPIPAFALLPLFIIWFGVTETSKIIMIAYMVFGSIYTYFVDGIRSVNPILIRSAKSLGANSWQVFTKVTLKSAMPNLFLGIKIGVGSTFSALVVAELMGANSGLGYMINYARNYFMLSQMFVAAIMIGLMYTLFLALLTRVEKVIFRWRNTGIENAVE